MNVLLDTNVVIALMKGAATVSDTLRRHRPGDVGISVVVLHELLFGAYRSLRIAANLERVKSLRFEILHLDENDADHAAKLRAHLARTGTPIGPYDGLIAGQALARGLTLVTRNTREFRRVDGLRVENWET